MRPLVLVRKELTFERHKYYLTVATGELYFVRKRIKWEASASNAQQHTSTLIKGFVRIARKKAEVSTPDEPSLKDAMASSEAERWQEAMEIEYEALLANGT